VRRREISGTEKAVVGAKEGVESKAQGYAGAMMMEMMFWWRIGSKEQGKDVTLEEHLSDLLVLLRLLRDLLAQLSLGHDLGVRQSWVRGCLDDKQEAQTNRRHSCHPGAHRNMTGRRGRTPEGPKVYRQRAGLLLNWQQSAREVSKKKQWRESIDERFRQPRSRFGAWS
jgi:hypothetical protein